MVGLDIIQVGTIKYNISVDRSALIHAMSGNRKCIQLNTIYQLIDLHSSMQCLENTSYAGKEKCKQKK